MAYNESKQGSVTSNEHIISVQYSKFKGLHYCHWSDKNLGYMDMSIFLNGGLKISMPGGVLNYLNNGEVLGWELVPPNWLVESIIRGYGTSTRDDAIEFGYCVEPRSELMERGFFVKSYVSKLSEKLLSMSKSALCKLLFEEGLVLEDISWKTNSWKKYIRAEIQRPKAEYPHKELFIKIIKQLKKAGYNIDSMELASVKLNYTAPFEQQNTENINDVYARDSRIAENGKHIMDFLRYPFKPIKFFIQPVVRIEDYFRSKLETRALQVYVDKNNFNLNVKELGIKTSYMQLYDKLHEFSEVEDRALHMIELSYIERHLLDKWYGIIGNMIANANLCIKVVDLGISAAISYKAKTTESIVNAGMHGIQFIGMAIGDTSIVMSLSVANIGYQVYQGEYLEATKSVATTLGYITAYSAASTTAPFSLLVVSGVFTLYSFYQSLKNSSLQISEYYPSELVDFLNWSGIDVLYFLKHASTNLSKLPHDKILELIYANEGEIIKPLVEAGADFSLFLDGKIDSEFLPKLDSPTDSYWL